MPSPLLEGADSAVVYYERQRNPNHRMSGRWMTTIERGGVVATDSHRSQREAREHIGLTGGSIDPDYQPAGGQIGREQAIRRTT